MTPDEKEHVIQALCASRYNSFYVAARFNHYFWISVVVLLLLAATSRLVVRGLSKRAFHHPLLDRIHYLSITPMWATYFTVFHYRLLTPNPFFEDQSGSFPLRQYLRNLADRTGVLSFGSTPLVVVLAARHSPVSWLTGFSFARLQVYHRWVSRVTFGFVLIHSLVFTFLIVVGQQEGWTLLRSKQYIRWGIAAFYGGLILCIASWRRLRELSYEVFLVGHIVGALAWIIGSYYHVALLHAQRRHLFWIYMATLYWALDRCARLISRLVNNTQDQRRTTAQVFTTRNGEFLRLRIKLPRNQRNGPGSHVYLSFNDLGWRRNFESHPFSIAWSTEAPAIDEEDKEAFEVIVRPCQGLTRSLARHVVEVCDPETSCRLDVGVMGPYGQIQHATDQQNVFMCAGGSGIAAALARLGSMATALTRDQLRTRHVILVWATRHADSVEILKPYLERLLSSGTWTRSSRRPFLKLLIHLTRPETSSTLRYSATDQHALVKASLGQTLFDSLHINGFCQVQVKSGRPDLPRLIDQALEIDVGFGQMLHIMACGPSGLVDQTREAARRRVFDRVRFEAEGGTW
ncbi:ferric-chelate reductase [Microbotryomycetes sp. JL221]|nr:ferric-chelate reductase [Microbotryomycetes sp. JL221]